jgi:hypothetical protein
MRVVEQTIRGQVCFLLVIMFGLRIDPEVGCIVFLRKVFFFSQTIRRYNPEDRTIHSYRCGNIKSRFTFMFAQFEDRPANLLSELRLPSLS